MQVEKYKNKQKEIPLRSEFILVNDLFCDTCKIQNSVIKISINIKERLQYLFFQCLNPKCKRHKYSREYFSILPLNIRVNAEILINQLKQQSWFISSKEIEDHIKIKMIEENK